MISVCMASHNGGKYIKQQIDSILSQLSLEDELIISDDGSSDSTIEIIKRCNDSRIKLYVMEHNSKGMKPHYYVTKNFENALKYVNGDYIFLSDQDDVWMPNKVSVVLEILKKVDLVVHDAELIDGDGNNMGKNYYSFLHQSSGFLMNLWQTRFLGCCMAFRKSVLDDCLPFPNNIVGHDYWIGMYALIKYEVTFIPDILLKYRRHGGNVSPSSEKSNNSLFYKLYTKRYHLLRAIAIRMFNAN